MDQFAMLNCAVRLLCKMAGSGSESDVTHNGDGVHDVASGRLHSLQLNAQRSSLVTLTNPHGF